MHHMYFFPGRQGRQETHRDSNQLLARGHPLYFFSKAARAAGDPQGLTPTSGSQPPRDSWDSHQLLAPSPPPHEHCLAKTLPVRDPGFPLGKKTVYFELRSRSIPTHKKLSRPNPGQGFFLGPRYSRPIPDPFPVSPGPCRGAVLSKLLRTRYSCTRLLGRDWSGTGPGLYLVDRD